MRVLGIDTSCDDTSAALLAVDEHGIEILTNIVSSQEEIHTKFGGIVPEIASRHHMEAIWPVVEAALEGHDPSEIGAVAVCSGPGLIGSLLVGVSFAKGLCYSTGIPLVAINHLEGHLLSAFLMGERPEFPFLSLIVSGGHTSMYRVDGYCDYTELGRTRDDAAGEAYDKVAKLLGLGYPGGPALARLAASGTAGRFSLPRPMLASADLDFSFSGLKTAVLTVIRGRELDAAARADLAAEIEAAIVEVLCAKALAALRHTGLKRLVVAGGVGANLTLRARLAIAARAHGFEVFHPELEFCTDNGAMIAFAAALRMQQSAISYQPSAAAGGFTVRPRWELETVSAQG
jgi:N6-L-threonylcarbamoyladenine synthase